MSGFPWACQPRVLLGVIILTVSGAAWCASQGTRVPRFWINTTSSAPRGLYRRILRTPVIGDTVLVPVPHATFPLTRQWGWPDDLLLLKPIAAMVGDRVCVQGARLTINGRDRAHVLQHASDGTLLPRLTGCQTVGPQSLFLLAPHTRSFDSRHFGPIDRQRVRAIVVPLWLWEDPA